MPAQHPFQKLAYPGKIADSLDLVVAASGPHIFVLNLLNGAVVSKWPYGDPKTGGREVALDGANESFRDEPSEKKRRLSTSQDDVVSAESSSSVEIEIERVKGRRRKPKLEPSLPKVSHLVTTADRTHLIAITAEDKCVRVFKINEHGQLDTLGERCMPKRPCAIVLEPRGKDLLVADKFGDVYSLPLFPRKEDSDFQKNSCGMKAVASDPSASELTVHTKGNLEALRQQRLQRASTERRTEKAVLSFEHTLLLGHVSLLTDLQAAVLPPKTSTNTSNKTRHYIITTDRDEHIRISRASPQSHIVEAYCHGHKHFVTKACLLSWQPEVLVAGCGTPSLRTYIWPEGRSLSEKNHLENSRISSALSRVRCKLHDRLRHSQLAVSGLWTMEYALGEDGQKPAGFVFASIEGLSVLLVFIKTLKQDLVPCEPIFTAGNVLDVVTIPSQRTLLISIDGAHMPGSMKAGNPSGTQQVSFIQVFTLRTRDKEYKWPQSDLIEETYLSAEDFGWEESPLPDLVNQTMIAKGTVNVDVPTEPNENSVYSPLGEFLYGLENLRKKTVQEKTDKGQSQKAKGALLQQGVKEDSVLVD